jgi:hypothetical protein
LKSLVLFALLVLAVISNIRTFQATHGSVDKGRDITLLMDVPRQSSSTLQTTANKSTKVIPPEKQDQVQVQNSTEFFVSACLLIKDDNDILNEWIAYHFHTLKLRHLIVAVDPSSHSPPKMLLDKWRQAPFHLQVDEWSDKDFMPPFFKLGHYHLVPNLISPPLVQQKPKKRPKKDEGQHEENVVQNVVTNSSNLQALNSSSINIHRFRQLTFLDACIKSLRRRRRTWMIHIDTDEYIVINPLLRSQRQGQLDTTRTDVHVTIPTKLSPNALAQVLQDAAEHDPESINYPCVSIPRLLFGSIEDDGVHIDQGEGDPMTASTRTKREVLPLTSSGTYVHTNSTTNSTTILFNRTTLETIRWKYHGPLIGQDNDGDDKSATSTKKRKLKAPEGGATLAYSPTLTTLGGPPKVMMDISAIPQDQFRPQKIAGQKRQQRMPPIHSIHRPSANMCRKTSNVNFLPAGQNIFTINHYVGSWARYNARSDARRSRTVRGRLVEMLKCVTNSVFGLLVFFYLKRLLCLPPFRVAVYSADLALSLLIPILLLWKPSRIDRGKKVYDVKANVTDGKDDDWMDSWLDHFVQEYGSEQVARVLADYVIKP